MTRRIGLLVWMMGNGDNSESINVYAKGASWKYSQIAAKVK